jgi:type I restriction enzyme M protein
VGLEPFDASHESYYGDELRLEPATPRSSDGQLLFLMEMVSKMKPLSQSPIGSRIASVHNGSALFTGDAGSGESNIRRYLIENDYLEAIIQLPNNLFYNTGITTYIWVLSNDKSSHRKGVVQLIDASNLYRKLRKNLGEKNCEFSPEHIKQITQCYLNLGENGDDDNTPDLRSKVFDNSDFGYYKVTVERPLRLKAQFTPERVASLRFVPALSDLMAWTYKKYGEAVYTELKAHKQAIEDYIEREEISILPINKKKLLDPKVWLTQRELMQLTERLMATIGQAGFYDFNQFCEQVDEALNAQGIKLSAPEKKQILNAVSWRDENAAKVIKKPHKLAGAKLDELCQKLGLNAQDGAETLADYGYWPMDTAGKPCLNRVSDANVWIEYESDSELRDYESVPLQEDIYGYFCREVRPHLADAWLNIEQSKIGYEISFNKYFYQHKPLRSLEEVSKDILALEAETEGLLKRLIRLTSNVKV